jgi:alcohol dehydrogenase
VAPNAGVTRVPLITITTTLSFAEFLPFWGARHAAQGRKLAYGDGNAIDRTIFLDGTLAAHTPDDVWAETGVKALDDALSAYCRSDSDEPFLDPVLPAAIAALDAWLRRSLGVDRADARQRVFNAAWVTKQPLPRLGGTTGAWFSTAARHARGSVLQIGHGAASCIALPAGVRFHAAETAARQGALAYELGWPSLADGLDALLDKLPVPRRLSALGIDADPLDEVAAQIVDEAPQLGSVVDVRRLLDALA